MATSALRTASFILWGLDVSPDNQLLAVAEDFLSRRQYDIRVKHLQSDTWQEEVISNTSGSFEWANDSKTLYYVRKHEKRYCLIRSIAMWWEQIRHQTN